ncbi:hypothetical protein D1007_23731 [Hordeum vulgare]|nr:hypothetical protein D1007_23731 [Hordeum vulgare]
MDSDVLTAAPAAMEAVLPSWPHPAAATETQVKFLGQGTIQIQVRQKPAEPDHPAGFLRLHGDLILSHGTRRAGVGPSGGLVDVADQVVRKFDHWVPVFDHKALNCVEVCSHSIHEMLGHALVTSDHDLLAAGNWVDALYTPALNIAMGIARYVNGQTDLDLAYDELDVDVKMPQLAVCLVYREPKPTLLPVARVLTRSRKRRRDACEAGEQCAICLLDLETEDEQTARLPCFHAFHSFCIQLWFYEATTCPSCRHDIMECISFARSASSEEFIYPEVGAEPLTIDDVAEDENFLYEVPEDDEYWRHNISDAEEYVDPEGWMRRHNH